VLKTAIRLTAACAGMFDEMFTRHPEEARTGGGAHSAADGPTGAGAYRWWTLGFVVVSFAIANAGLETIIGVSVPVLMFLYPIAIVVTAIGLLWPLVEHRLVVARTVVAFTAVAAFFDLLAALPDAVAQTPVVAALTGAAGRVLPGYAVGFGWIVPALAGLVVGLAVHAATRGRRDDARRTTSVEG